MTEPADVLFPQTTPPATDTPRPSTDAELIRTMYPNMFNESLRDGLKELTIDGGTPEEIEEARGNLSESFHAVGVSPSEARTIVDAMVQVSKSEPTPEQVAAWEAETRRALHDRYGAEAPERLRRANAIVAKSPALQQALRESGLGNRLDIVTMFVERAYSL